MELRPYQFDNVNEILNAWRTGHRNVLSVLPTGSGKTVVFSYLINHIGGAAAAIAHRSELVAQISLALAIFGVRHRIVAPDNVAKFIMENNFRETGNTFVDPNSAIGVVSIDTLKARWKKGHLVNWARQVGVWVQDEAHHVLKKNKWGIVSEIFPNAYGLGVTATPLRADGQGLGRHHDGVFDVIVEGPDMRWMIDHDYLSDYRVYVPPTDMNLTDLKIGSTGDYTPAGLKVAAKESHIVGDVVEHYLKIAPGKLGVTFATDVETAGEIANKYCAAGVNAMMISAKTPDRIRAEVVRRWRAGEIKQVVNVDLFGEGFDSPALEVVSMARPTQSFGLYAQQFGRACRPFPGKDKGIIIDHVANVVRHGLPDSPRAWSLDRRDKKSRGFDPDVLPVTACVKCFRAYEGFKKSCPFCGHVPEPEARNHAKFVEGDLQELDAETLAAMRGDLDKVNLPAETMEKWALKNGHSEIVARGIANRHRDRQQTQIELREAMGQFGAKRRDDGADDSEIRREFYWRFKTDVMTAQTLGTADAKKLENLIRKEIRR